MKESELLVLTQADFYRVFRQSEDSWINAVKQARNKEKEYLIRCRSYLDTSKLVLDKSNNEVLKKKMGRVYENEQQKADRRVKAIRERDNRKAHERRFNERQEEENRIIANETA